MTRSLRLRSGQTPAAVAALLFGSGFCALIYQTAWLRQFRLIFGASTFATAAVLAIFMGGLGVGSALLGKRADAHPRPLAYYGNLELGVALSAALSPVLLWMVAKIYFAMGGSVTLGLVLATVVRLLLSALVLAVPTVLMGGTLPAAARAIETSDDAGRRRLALLYGVNTLGAVVGTVSATFFMLETFGNRKTLMIAVLINAVVGITARSWGVGARGSAPDTSVGGGTDQSTGRAAARPYMTLTAAALVGFAFLLMELVWYRMLAPLLGGSTFTFGLILAIALFGIGLGGAAYSLFGRGSVGGFALTCSLEAAFIALPFALGDRLAAVAALLQPLAAIGFAGRVGAWGIVAGIAVLPPAIIAGFQFPLLVALAGEGREGVGRDVGTLYAWNTAGAIAGSIAGGFGLLPLLSAPGAWRVVVVLLALAAVVTRRPIASAIAALAVAAIIIPRGPTAYWRHAGIAAGRAGQPSQPNTLHEAMNSIRAGLRWDVDGRESGIGLMVRNEISFVVNGKSDGSSRTDAGTQVMAGLVGAMLHPGPRRAMVIGLGTGSTAGWLAAVPSIERVDVAEIEPAVLRVARECAAVNRDVLRNPKVLVRIADAREVLLTTGDRYDIIFSEPSNPYRAGIASLFTEEFYRAAAGRLNRGGIFLQWVQAYDVDAQTIRTIYATIRDVFPAVETWQTTSGDLLLVATAEPLLYDIETLRARLAREPFRTAAHVAWRVESLEGWLAHFVANDAMATALREREIERNSDDRTPIEFGFARFLASGGRFSIDQLVDLAQHQGWHRPRRVRGAIDFQKVDLQRSSIVYVSVPPLVPSAEAQGHRGAAILFEQGRLPELSSAWLRDRKELINTRELAAVGAAVADAGNEIAIPIANALRAWHPAESDIIVARLRYRQQRLPESTALLESAFHGARSDPWPSQATLAMGIETARLIAAADEGLALAPQLDDALVAPLAAGNLEEGRRQAALFIAHRADGCGARTLRALRAMEPDPFWTRDALRLRRDCYAAAGMSEASCAARDLEAFDDAAPQPLWP